MSRHCRLAIKSVEAARVDADTECADESVSRKARQRHHEIVDRRRLVTANRHRRAQAGEALGRRLPGCRRKRVRRMCRSDTAGCEDRMCCGSYRSCGGIEPRVIQRAIRLTSASASLGVSRKASQNSCQSWAKTSMIYSKCVKPKPVALRHTKFRRYLHDAR